MQTFIHPVNFNLPVKFNKPKLFSAATEHARNRHLVKIKRHFSNGLRKTAAVATFPSQSSATTVTCNVPRANPNVSGANSTRHERKCKHYLF